MRGVYQRFVRWLNSPRLLDQFQSILDSQDVLELTEDMIYDPRPDPFGRFKRKYDAAQG